MGVALIIVPLIIAVFLSPFVYTFISIFLIKKVRATGGKKLSLFITVFLTILFLIYPATLFNEYKKFADTCNNDQPKYTINPNPNIHSIAFAHEQNSYMTTVSLDHEMMVYRLNLQNYEYAAMRNGDLIIKHACTAQKRKCVDTANLENRYMFFVSEPKLNAEKILQSDISIIDNQTGLTIFMAHEYILGGILGAYHGQFISKESHRGYLACGYLSNKIEPWRPNGGNFATTMKYVEKEVAIIEKFFPALTKE